MITDLKLIGRSSEDVCISNSSERTPPIPIERNLGFDRKLEKLRKTLPYHTEYVKSEFSDELWQAMEQRGFSQARFSKKANVSKQFLTKIFRGENCTIETMVRLAFALNFKVNIHLTPIEIGCAWIHNIPVDATKPRTALANLYYDSRYSVVNASALAETPKTEQRRESIPSIS